MKKAFDISPNDIIGFIRFSYIEDIKSGGKAIQKNLLFYLEFKAISVLEKENKYLMAYAPSIKDGFDARRQFWFNEALHNSDEYGGLPIAGNHLSINTRSCFDILTLCSEVRRALESGNAEMISALSMLLVCEVFSGGLFFEMEKSHAAQKKRFEKGAGEQVKINNSLRVGSIKRAKMLWKKDDSMRVGDVVDEISSFIKLNKDKFEELKSFPKKETIKTWLKDAAKNGDIQIPLAALRPGRPIKA